jgi:hypothetical protein
LALLILVEHPGGFRNCFRPEKRKKIAFTARDETKEDTLKPS